jgi:hypothetical protein
MQQRRRGLAGNPAVAVGRAGRDAFEQAEHRADPRDCVESCDEMHFRSTGICEADVHAAIDQRLSERLRAIHFTAHDSKGLSFFGNQDRNEPACTPERPLLHR